MSSIRPGRALRLAAAALVLFSISACDVVFQQLTAKATEATSRTYTLQPGGTVDVTNISGSITVEGVPGDKVEVAAEKTVHATSEEAAKDLLKQVQIAETVLPKEIRLETRRPQGVGMRMNVEVRYRLRVPQNASVRLRTTNGTLTVDGVQLGVVAEATNGTVTLRKVSGSVDASTTNGSIEAGVDAIGPDGVKLETTNGSIELTLPSSAKADVAARCVNGTVSADNLNVVREASGETSRRRLEGKLNGGGPKIDLETVNGRVRLVGK